MKILSLQVISNYKSFTYAFPVALVLQQVYERRDGYFQILMENEGNKFWLMDPLVWDEVNNVGLRNHYICSVYAARLMVPRKSGLIVNISSTGGFHYVFNVPFGVGKEAVIICCKKTTAPI